MSQPKKLTWNDTQQKVLKEINAGEKSHHVIAKEVGCSVAVVTKVHNAVKKGQSPANPYVPKQKNTSNKAASKINKDAAAVEAAVHAGEVKKNAEALAKADKDNPESTPGSAPKNTGQHPSATTKIGAPDATIARVTPMPVLMPLTPIMYSAKAYLVEKRNWHEDVRWEDIIDTIFAAYFKSVGVVLRGWYEEEPAPAPKPASVKDKGNGNKNELQQLADLVTLQIIDLASQGKFGKVGV